MELMYRQPEYIKYGIPAVLVCAVLLHLFRGRMGYGGGRRVANTALVKELPAFREAFLRRRIISGCMLLSMTAALISMLFLYARPYTSKEEVIGQERRDIFLCFDTTFYLDSINEQIFNELIELVRGLNGDRFGISVYDSTSLLYVPLTDDYGYVIGRLERLRDFYKYGIELDGYFLRYANVPEDLPAEEKKRYEEIRPFYDKVNDELFYAISSARDVKGRTLLGDGIASCMLSFPRLIGEEKRSRVIIFPTSNVTGVRAAQGLERLYKPQIEFPDAAVLCAQHDVALFPLMRGLWCYENNPPASQRLLVGGGADIRPQYEEAKAQLLEAARVTDGKFYEFTADTSAKDIMKDIRKQPAMRVKDIVRTVETEHPETPATVLMVSVFGVLLCAIRLKLA